MTGSALAMRLFPYTEAGGAASALTTLPYASSTALAILTKSFGEFLQEADVKSPALRLGVNELP